MARAPDTTHATRAAGRPGGGLARRQVLRRCAALLGAAAAALGLRPGRGEAAAAGPGTRLNPERRLKWLAFYGQSADEAALSAYDVVVLDPMFQGDLARIGAGGSHVCAYLSLGEVRLADESLARLDPACLLQENPAWPGTWRVDVRAAAWRDVLLHERLPAIRARGFTGLMLDTLDTPPWLEAVDPVGNRGMRQASIDLVRAIRQAYPDMLVIVNRGYATLAQLCPMIDAVLAESLLTSPDAAGFHANPPGEVQAQLALLAPARDARLPILSLDYWDPGDAAGIRDIYQRQRALGHQPYVATPLLGDVVREPNA